MWIEYPLDHCDLSGLELHANMNLDFLKAQIACSLEGVASLHYRGDSPELPLFTQRRPSTEHWLRRGSSRLLISIGESFTWSENLYGLASGAPGGSSYHPLIQTLFTIQGRLAHRGRADLRALAMPGCATNLMISALSRILTDLELSGDLAHYKEILVLQQFTERSRCGNNRGHQGLPWYNAWINPEPVFTFNHYHVQEQRLLTELNTLVSKWQSRYPLRCMVWRNFDPWIVKDLTAHAHLDFVDLSLSEFKYRMLGLPVAAHPVFFAHNTVDSYNIGTMDQEDFLWIQQQIQLTEQLFKFLRDNKYLAHPTAEMTVLWSRYLHSQGVAFS